MDFIPLQVKVGATVVHSKSDAIGTVIKIVRNAACMLEAHVRMGGGSIVTGSATVGMCLAKV